MRISELGKFYPEKRKAEEQKENPETEKDEISSTPEQAERKISTTEAIVFAGLLGLKAYVIFDNKREKVKKAVDEAKQDFQTQPVAAKEIAGGLLMQLGSLALESQHEPQ